ncbi:IPT/TIG domain-containing protein [Chitinophagaceae bacterium 26-R-25]|nr:IPT/TIG domain-containing protein [Chitinophagaceae bacterium 26-R-25]
MLRNILNTLMIGAIGVALIITGCKKNKDVAPESAGASAFSPQQGGAGTEVLINGENFPYDASKISVTINGIKIPIVRSNEEQILIAIPKDKAIGSGPISIALGDSTIITKNNFTYLRTRTVTTLAGTGERGYQDGPGNQAKFMFTTDWGEERRGGIDVDSALNVYVADPGNQCIRKISPDGKVSTVAGNPTASPDWGINWRLDNGGAGSYNAVVRPTDVKLDSKGNMYVTDDWQGCMVMFEPDGKAHYLGWGGGVNSIAVDEANNTLYLNDCNAGIIYKSAMTNYGPSPADKQQIITGVKWSAGMVVDKKNGDFYLVWHDANKILKYKKDDWSNPTVVAGSGTAGYVDGSALSAQFYYPWGIALDASGNLYVGGNGSAGASADAKDQSVRFIEKATGNVTTFAGAGSAGATDGSFGIATFAGVNSFDGTKMPALFKAPTGVAVDKNGTVYVLDRGNNMVRKIVTE